MVFFLSFLYAVGFIGNFVVPKSIDVGPQTNTLRSLAINLILLGLFALQHSIMARPAFKRWWTRFIPTQIERSTYVLLASLLLLLLFWQWCPMTTVVWSIENPIGKAILWGFFWLGWLIVLLSTYMIDHFELFGLRQVYLYLREQKLSRPPFTTKYFYRFIRHPIMLGFIIAFWSTPHMTTGHLLFAIATTLYILIGIQFEEHDLLRFLGDDYKDYQRRVPMLIPLGRKAKSLIDS